MLFNSLQFLLFFPVVCIIYFIIPGRFRNLFLLISSYYFYLNWEPIYCVLILCSTISTWLTGIWLQKVTTFNIRKLILFLGIIVNLSILILFKYADFITDSAINFLELLNIRIHIPKFNFLLPVGISFYTFQAIGYMTDVYKKKITAEKNIKIFGLFIAFFPQLVAGPIERASHLLPQFHKTYKFDAARVSEGLKLILWGYFMKTVIADRLSIYVDSVYGNVAYHSSITLILATVFFAFQIYCDFGGYSNIAIGCARIMGFNLSLNFRRPYLACNVTDFWRRWHITLSTWFRDYIYIPLGGNRCSKKRNNLNLLITFLISGLWHGANWTYILWGGLNGIFQVFEKTIKPIGQRLSTQNLIGKNTKTVLSVGLTFILICFTWIFFRSNNVRDSFIIIQRIFEFKGNLFTDNIDSLVYGIPLIFILYFSDILQERNNGAHYFLDNKRKTVRYITYLGIVTSILLIGVFDNSQFIYFQF